MKTWVIILLFVLIIGAAGGFYLYKKKIESKQEEEKDTDIAPKPHIQSDPRVKQIQQWLNSFDVIQPKLAEDGIWGPKTQAAFDKIKQLKQQGKLDDDGVIEKVVKTAANLSLPGLIYNEAKGVFETVKNIWK